MHLIAALSNLLLIAACLYALIILIPEDQRYGYLAASFNLVHGFLGLVRAFQEEPECECGPGYMISASIAEGITLPLANIEFYLLADLSAVAMAHALSLIPLFYDILGKLDDEWDSTTATLKDLALLSNIASTSYLGFRDKNRIYYAVAGLTFIARFGPASVEYLKGCSAEYVATLGNAGIVALLTYTLTK